MTELGELEAHWQDFNKLNVRVVVVSVEDASKAKATQTDFPHLEVVSDEARGLSNAVEVIHPQSDPAGGDTAAPTTLLIDGQGNVRWLFRPDRVMTRLSLDRGAFVAATRTLHRG